MQAKYKLKYNKKQKMWAEIFRINFEKAIVLFKTKKREVFEQKAAKAMVDVLKKHKFRNKLAMAIKARHTFIKGAYVTAYINKLRKHLCFSNASVYRCNLRPFQFKCYEETACLCAHY